ncbi:hypothetical protein C9374_011669 [Naegleria lovaniensis]|uniref:Ras family small GTPase n=1 Tax=Naegleria lovaniensis TaxID=51637 RepID=A0AA88GEP0_NAELO|nr:uncharacterized protein C9374_011669 [Naegleria lovaniensis]KAG2374004.1 hypothetical protein C9374_011669 [Naegleria lovaniensis]
MKSEIVMEFLVEFWWKIIEQYCGKPKQSSYSILLKDLKQEMSSKQCMKRCVSLFLHINRKFMEAQTKTTTPFEQIAILGDDGVGKSGLLLFYLTNYFYESFDQHTIEDSYRITSCIDNKTVNLEILDTAGPPNLFRNVYIRKANSFILACAVDNMLSAQNLDDILQHIFSLNEDALNGVFVFAMNKCDLSTQVGLEAVHNVEDILFRLINKLNWNIVCAIIETSSKNNINTTLVFEECVRGHISGRDSSRNIDLLRNIVKMDKQGLELWLDNSGTTNCLIV